MEHLADFSSFSLRLECQTVVSLLLTDLNHSQKRPLSCLRRLALPSFILLFHNRSAANVLVLEHN